MMGVIYENWGRNEQKSKGEKQFTRFSRTLQKKYFGSSEPNKMI